MHTTCLAVIHALGVPLAVALLIAVCRIHTRQRKAQRLRVWGFGVDRAVRRREREEELWDDLMEGRLI